MIGWQGQTSGEEVFLLTSGKRHLIMVSLQLRLPNKKMNGVSRAQMMNNDHKTLQNS